MGRVRQGDQKNQQTDPGRGDSQPLDGKVEVVPHVTSCDPVPPIPSHQYVVLCVACPDARPSAGLAPCWGHAHATGAGHSAKAQEGGLVCNHELGVPQEMCPRGREACSLSCPYSLPHCPLKGFPSQPLLGGNPLPWSPQPGFPLETGGREAEARL